MHKERIRTLDGLRFLAALGVLWIHAWTKFGNPRLYVGKIDLANILAIGGNGVDLFFVISGFCMYYFYATSKAFSYRDFGRFLKKRWLRLSPAFYASGFVYLTFAKLTGDGTINIIRDNLSSLLYLNVIIPNPAAYHFWTLSVEWQFYLLIPFILIYQGKIGFWKIFGTLTGVLLLVSIALVIFLKHESDLYASMITFRWPEFACGILVAYITLRSPAALRHRWLLMIIAMVVVYTGRILLSRQVLALSAEYYNLFKLSGFTIMGAGFAGVLYLSLTSRKWLLLLLGNSLFKTLGRISYSFYLWHGLVLGTILQLMHKHCPRIVGMKGAITSTIVSGIILYFVSQLSYKLLEKPFLSISNLNLKKQPA